MTDTVQTPAPVAPKKCDISQVLTAVTLELIKQSPENTGVRSMVHSELLRPIPKELVTFDTIKDWVEKTIDKPAGSIDDLGGLIPPTQNEAEAFRINVRCSEDQVGTACWTEHVHGSANYAISRRELQGIIAEAIGNGEDLSGLVERVQEYFQEEAADHNPHMESDSGPHYDDHETTERDNFSASVDRGQLGNLILNYLRVNDREALEALRS